MLNVSRATVHLSDRLVDCCPRPLALGNSLQAGSTDCSIDKVELVSVRSEIKRKCLVNYTYKILIIMITKTALLFFFSIILR